MGAACCQDGAVSLEALASNQHHTITQLGVEALVVELLENMLKVTRKVHNVVEFVVSQYCRFYFVASVALLATQQHKEGHCQEQAQEQLLVIRISSAGNSTRLPGLLTLHTSLPPVRGCVVEVVVYLLSAVAGFPTNALEYGRARSNNNTEGCGALSSFVSENSPDICTAAPPLLRPQLTYNVKQLFLWLLLMLLSQRAHTASPV